MKIYMIICYLCYEFEGDIKPASHKYYAKGAEEWYDICDNHTGLLRKDGFKIEMIPQKERIFQVEEN